MHDELFAVVSGEATSAELEHVRHCSSCRAEQQKLGGVVDAFIDAPPAPVPEGGLQRLLSRARSTSRLSFFTDALAGLFDVSHDEAAALLARVADTHGWQEGPAPGIEVLPVRADAVLLRVAPGARHPMHTHASAETALVLEGGFRDLQGVEVWRGESQRVEAGSQHELVAFEDVGCVCAVKST